MLISIIVPVYNAEKYLSRCLDSILNQTYSNIEVIIVNDGSKDDSLEICKKYALSDKRILLIDQENKGPASARNIGIKKATGDYIGFVDSDDFIESNMYENLEAILHNLHPDVIVSNFRQYDFNNITSDVVRNKLPYGKLLTKHEIKKYFIFPYYGGYLGIIPSLWNKIYKADFIKTHHLIIDESRIRAEDYWFNFDVFKKATTVVAVDEAYYHYFRNEGSIMHVFRENQFELYLKTREKLLLENKEGDCKINWEQFNAEFINNTNEYILIGIKHKGFTNSYNFVLNILKNKEFNSAFKKIGRTKIHVNLINNLLNFNFYYVVFLIYYAWSKKLK